MSCPCDSVGLSHFQAVQLVSTSPRQLVLSWCLLYNLTHLVFEGLSVFIAHSDREGPNGSD